MSNEQEEQVPGITFWFVKSELAAAQGKEKLRATLTLECVVNDEQLWAEVQRKFVEGFRVFTSPDFHLEVLDVMRARIQELETQYAVAERRVQREITAKELVEKELEQYKAPLRALGRTLRGEPESP